MKIPPPTQQIDIQVVNGTAQWIIPQNVLARKISQQDFANLPSLKGLTIQQGVAAYVYIDGREASELHSGTYEFISQSEIEDFLNKKTSSGLLGKIDKAIKSLGTLITGKKVRDQIQQNNDINLKSVNTIDEVINRLRTESVIDIYLVSEAPFSVIFGSGKSADGNRHFSPFTIMCRHLNLDVMVTLQFRVSDPKSLIYHYLSRQNYFTTYNVEEEFKSRIQYILESELRNVDIDEYGIPAPVRNSIEAQIKTLSGFMPGIELIGVRDISTSNKDFERLRSISDELFVSDKELEAAIRTNEFRNRLATVENQRKIDEAKNGLALHTALSEIDKEKILHEDELDSFYIMISRQRQIRDAKNEEEIRKALQDIKMTRLISEDDLDALILQLSDKKLEREAISQIINMQHLNDVEMKRLELEEQLNERMYSREDRELDHQHNILRKSNRFNQNTEIEELEHDVRKTDIKLTGTRKVDAYQDERFEKERARNREENQWKLEMENRAEDERQRRRERRDRAFLENAAMISKLHAEEAQMKHEQEMEATRAAMEHERNMSSMAKAHEEKMRELETQMSYEQLLASRKDLDANAQTEMAKGVGSAKQLEQERKNFEEMKRMQEYYQSRERESQKETRDMFAGIIDKLIDNQQGFNSEKERLMEERLRQQENLTREYREEKYKAQERQDNYSQHVMNHEENVQKASVNAINAMAGSSRQPQQAIKPEPNETKCPECGNMVPLAKFCKRCGSELSISPNK